MCIAKGVVAPFFKWILGIIRDYPGLSWIFGWHVSTPGLSFVRYYTLFIFSRQMLLICARIVQIGGLNENEDMTLP